MRGFGDRATVPLPGGKTVWQQPLTPTPGSATQYPWRLSGARTWDGATPPSPELGAAGYGGTSHGRDDQHGVPRLPATGALIPEVEYVPQPGDNRMPAQETGTKRARPLPYQPNANLTGVTRGVAHLAFSNVAPFATRASHFSVYDNRSPIPALSDHPAAPHTVKVPARGTKTLTIDPLAASHGWYDLTVTADNDHTWSQRLTGHLETGRASITG